MIAKQYVEMLGKKSKIRELSEFAVARGKEIGYENVFDFTLGNPSVPAPQIFTDKMIELLRENEPVALHGYSQSLGIYEVRAAVAKSLRNRFGLPYRAEHIFMTSGAAGAIAHAVRCVCESGDEVITFAPFFPEYMPYINQSGAVLKIVPANFEDFQIRFDELEKMINERTSALLINTPNNPSGVVYSEETLIKLAELLERKQKEYGREIFIISDEPYREIVFDGKEYPLPERYYDNTIMCYSFSKSLSIPGERIGYVAFPPSHEKSEMMSVMCGQISRGIGHNCPASIIQLAIADVLYDTADLSVYEKNRNIICETLDRLGFTYIKPNGTFYVLPKALEEDATAFCQKATKYDIVLVPADSFGAPGYFRIAYCVSIEKVERAMIAFERFVREEYKI